MTEPAKSLLAVGIGMLLTLRAGAGEDRKIKRGYLDRGYAVDSLDGRTLHVQGMSKANARIEKTLEVAAYDEEPLAMDSLYGIFNARLLQALKQKLGKSKVIPSAPDPQAGGALLRKLIGEPVVPDSFLITIPEPPAGGGSEISLVVGKAVLGVRSQQVLKYRAPSPGDPNYPFNSHHPKLPPLPKFKQRFYLEDDDPLEQEEPADPFVTKEKQKRFYTLVEFCFYDHRAKRAFGYGWDGVESDFRGEPTKFLFGKKLDLDRHMRKQADQLVALLLRKGDLVGNYRETEIVIVKQATRPTEIIREELEEEGEEE